MIFLIDENLPDSIGKIFSDRGFEARSVRQVPELRGKPDEVVFNYGVANHAVIVTRDLNFANPRRFDIKRLAGIIVLRLPNEISIPILFKEVESLPRNLQERNFRQLIVIQPGFARFRKVL